MQVLSNDVPKLSKSGFDQSVWRDRSKNVELREAALANGNAAESSQVSLDSSRPGTSGSQVLPCIVGPLSKTHIALQDCSGYAQHAVVLSLTLRCTLA